MCRPILHIKIIQMPCWKSSDCSLKFHQIAFYDNIKRMEFLTRCVGGGQLFWSMSLFISKTGCSYWNERQVLGQKKTQRAEILEK